MAHSIPPWLQTVLARIAVERLALIHCPHTRLHFSLMALHLDSSPGMEHSFFFLNPQANERIERIEKCRPLIYSLRCFQGKENESV